MLARLQVEGRALSAGVLHLNGHYVVQTLSGLQGHQGGHQLGDAGNEPWLIRVVLIEHPAAASLHQNGGGGRGPHRLGRRDLGEKQKGRK